jgi:ABC-type Fe3+ transport system permease subunit
MLDDGDYSTYMLVEMTIFCMYVFGLVFLFNPGTDFTGFLMLGYSNFALLTVLTYNAWRTGKEDIIAFAIVAGVSLSFVGILFCIFFYYRIKTTQDVFVNPGALDGLPRDVLNLFKTVFIAVFVFTTIVVFMFTNRLYSGKGLVDGSVIVKSFAAFFNGTKMTSEEQDKEKSYIVFATIFTSVLLAVASYNVYVANFLKSIIITN